jgi:hypothetical protein
MLGIDKLFYCPENNFKFELSGTISGNTAKLMTF